MKRKILLAGVIGLFLLAGIGYGAWWLLVGRWHETTEDAYVGGNLVQVTPQVAGVVVAIHADDTDYVNAGQPLVELDKADAEVALSQAEAQLARTVRGVRNLTATSTEAESTVRLRRTDLARAQQDLARRQAVEGSGAVSGEEIQHALDAVAAARASVQAAERQLQAQRAIVEHTTVRDHPDVLAASAKVREAYLTLSRTSLPAPVSGFVARRSAQVGQRVAAGTPLMTVVPLEAVWVDANFKENQLADMRAGQPVELTADAYGNSVTYRGRVAGFSAGTGAAFALLPAQNASGNWIKVVQRVPVRVELERKDLEAHPLQVGLSMHVDVDTHQRGGPRLQKSARSAPAYETRAFAPTDGAADARIERIIAANSGEGISAAGK
jgi:membrane fusion protein (multidrug efflux system)